MKKTVFALADNEGQANRIVDRLISSGFQNADISILYPDTKNAHRNDQRSNMDTRSNDQRSNMNTRSDDYNDGHSRNDTLSNAHYDTVNTNTNKDRHDNGRSNKNDLGTENATKAPEGATTGATTGGLLGGTLGLLAGLGALAIPGVGPFIAAGPLMAALSGSAIGGSLGGIVGAIVGYGIPEYEAVKYESGLKKGKILLSITTNSEELADKASEIMKQNGGTDISSSTEKASRN
ncbi:MAG: DUF3341 domain-containing protein [Parachlamydiaceae bacterium]|nr:DUF3341 domain-containing protein [Parachlamydiaceae bacterium]